MLQKTRVIILTEKLTEKIEKNENLFDYIKKFYEITLIDPYFSFLVPVFVIL